MTIKEQWLEMKSTLKEMKDDIRKVDELQQKKAGTRIRKGLQEIKRMAQELRIDIIEETR